METCDFIVNFDCDETSSKNPQKMNFDPQNECSESENSLKNTIDFT